MRLILLAACWLILTDGDPDGWLFGLAVILPVAYAWHRFFPPTGFRIRALQIPLFAGWFAGQSLLAGLELHCLDTRDDNLSGVRRAEARVAALFGVPVATPATEACRV